MREDLQTQTGLPSEPQYTWGYQYSRRIVYPAVSCLERPRGPPQHSAMQLQTPSWCNIGSLFGWCVPATGLVASRTLFWLLKSKTTSCPAFKRGIGDFFFLRRLILIRSAITFIRALSHAYRKVAKQVGPVQTGQSRWFCKIEMRSIAMGCMALLRL